MKFAQLLQEEVVPEWRKVYLNYKQGKKYLDAIEVALANQEKPVLEPLEPEYDRPDVDEGNETRPLKFRIDPRHPGNATTSKPEYGHLESLVEVDSQEVLDLPTRMTPNFIQSRGRVGYDSIRTLPHTPISSGGTQLRATSSHGHLSERSPTLQGAHGTLGQQQQEKLQPPPGEVEGNSIDSVMDQLLDEERVFFKFLDSQLAMVDAFHQEKELEAVTKFKVLKQQLHVADEWKRRHDEKVAKQQDKRGWYQAGLKVRRSLGTSMGDCSEMEDITHGSAHPSDKKCQGSGAFSTAKPEATIGGDIMTTGQGLRQRESRPPANSQQVEQSSLDPIKWHNHLLLVDEEKRRQHLNHKVARARIKAALYEFYRSLEMLKNYKILNNTGFVKIMKKYDKIAEWKASKAFVASKLGPAYFMSSTVLDDLFDETENLFIDKFENGRRRRGMAKLRIPDSRRQLPAFFMLALGFAIYLDFGSPTTAPAPYAYYYPLIVVICPLPIINWSARKWFLASIGRILLSGYYNVEFRDFFLADEMNSLAYSIEQFEFAICAYAHEWNDLALKCNTSQIWLTPFVTALPAWFRFLQCLRRYHDTLEWFPHLANCAKYSISLVQIFVYFSYRYSSSDRVKTAYIAISIGASIYTFAWDVYMDWGLFRFGKHGGGAYGHPFLRPELVYSWEWVYYLAILLNFLARFSWVMRLVPMNVNPLVLAFSLALVEIFRRWMWNFFRLENEHLNNCGQFRAIKDIPLPFNIRVEGESDVEEGKERHDEGQGRDDMEIVVEGLAPIEPRSTSLWKRPTERSQTSYGKLQSGTFVENAMTEAGFGNQQREFISLVNKFFDRRDFDAKVVDGTDGLFKSRAQSDAVGSPMSPVPAPDIVQIEGPSSIGAIGAGRSGRWRGGVRNGRLFGWNSEYEEVDTDDDDDDDGDV
ncbi:Xenotropic and polytropic retrovirus receptor 1 [Modicella reniformis]|uniref:Xenotropic and polytropic retrovirus receptor 1 n=1 Tax=Modicella reniformis TaxID=1440133 RepID=A0A9P6M2R5_9FUNG|nr:Xenotropic and polytropic retrovirus receptor 1 [Modicella reniformis]